MKRRRGGKRSVLVVLCLLFVGLQTLGVTYANWAETQQIHQNVLTGALEVDLAKGQSQASLVDGNGKERSAKGVELQIEKDGKSAQLTVNGGFAAQALADGEALRLEVPIQLGHGGTVETVKRLEADLTAETDEQITLRPTQVELVVDGGVAIPPEGALREFQETLEADVYRQLEETQEGVPVAVVYLRLTEESRRSLLDLKDATLSLEAGDLSDKLLEAAGAEGAEESVLRVGAEVHVTYVCKISLYVEQGNGDSIPLPGEE